MEINQVKLAIVAKKNEAVSGLVNNKHENLADARYLQGIIHGLDAAFSILKQLEFQQVKDSYDD